MKKILKIIYINLSIIFLILIIGEITGYFYYYNTVLRVKENYNKSYNITEKKFTKKEYIALGCERIKKRYFEKIYYFNTAKDFRPPAGLKYKKSSPDKSPIVLLGCSFPYGYGLSNEESFHNVLSKYTKRPVYNLGNTGGSLREALYILRNKKLRTKLLGDSCHVKYFIYTFIPSHIDRLYSNFREMAPFYYEKNGHLKYYMNYLGNRSFLYYFLMFYYKDHFINNEKAFELLKLYIKELNQTIQNNYNNYNEPSKLVVFVYADNKNYDWKQIENKDIIVIKSNEILDVDITDKEYQQIWDRHPNAKAWQVIVPALSKKLNLI